MVSISVKRGTPQEEIVNDDTAKQQTAIQEETSKEKAASEETAASFKIQKQAETIKTANLNFKKQTKVKQLSR